LTPWRLINFQRFSAFENMAIDEAIFLETTKTKKIPTIRFYGWRPVAVSIGYFQDPAKEVNIEECLAHGVDIVRRPSGGKAVFHCDEVTYSIISSNSEKTFPSDILETYKIISNCLVSGLAYMGINAQLSENGRIQDNDSFKSCCFSAPSRNELLVAGRKICGSAQMRTSGGFLQHGSILLNFDPSHAASFLLPTCNEEQLQKLKNSVATINQEVAVPLAEKDICSNLIKGFIDTLGIEIREDKLTSTEEDLKKDLLNKYSDWHWNREKMKGRLKSYMYGYKRNLASA
jgi:lipoyl(octanoyl) transferase